MSQHGTAKAGHGGTAGSGGDGGTARDDPAAEAARVGVAGIGPEGEAGTASAFGDGQSEAEAQLYAYMDLMTNSKAGQRLPAARRAERPSERGAIPGQFALSPGGRRFLPCG